MTTVLITKHSLTFKKSKATSTGKKSSNTDISGHEENPHITNTGGDKSGESNAEMMPEVPQTSVSISDIKMENEEISSSLVSDHTIDGTDLHHESSQKHEHDITLPTNCDEREGKDMEIIEEEVNIDNTKQCEGVTDCKAGVSVTDETTVAAKLVEAEDTEQDKDVLEDKGPNNVRIEGAKVKMRVPDGGWGWMVAFGAFLVTFTVIPMGTCFGILFSDYLLREGVSSTTTAWIYNVFMMVWHGMMTLIGPLTQEFGTRPVAFTACGITVTGTIVSAFTPSPYILFFSISVLSGIGAGLVVGLSYTVVSPFFDKRRGMANAVLVAGSPVGQIAMAPLVRYLLDQYSFRGATLIYSGLIMNALIGIAFFHPLKWHLKPVHEDLGEARQILLHQENGSPFSRSPDHHSTQSLSQQNSFENAGNLKQDQLLAIKQKLKGSCVSLASADIIKGIPSSSIRSSCNNSEDSLSSAEDGIIMRLWNTFGRVFRATVSNLSLLSSLRVCIIASSFMLSSVSFLNFSMMVPFAMHAAGHPLRDSAWCISTLGTANLLIRFVVSPMSDWKKFSIRVCFMTGYFLKAVAQAGFAFSLQAGYPAVWTGIYGTGVGMTISMQALVIVWYMGTDLLPAAYGVTGVAAAIGFPILGPVIGLVRDLTGSYLPSLWMLAAMDLLCCLLWLPMPAAVAKDLARARRKTGQEKNRHDP